MIHEADALLCFSSKAICNQDMNPWCPAVGLAQRDELFFSGILKSSLVLKQKTSASCTQMSSNFLCHFFSCRIRSVLHSRETLHTAAYLPFSEPNRHMHKHKPTWYPGFALRSCTVHIPPLFSTWPSEPSTQADAMRFHQWSFAGVVGVALWRSFRSGLKQSWKFSHRTAARLQTGPRALWAALKYHKTLQKCQKQTINKQVTLRSSASKYDQ